MGSHCGFLPWRHQIVRAVSQREKENFGGGLKPLLPLVALLRQRAEFLLPPAFPVKIDAC